jgi:tetratricopeptide (TPR) repeat protein
LKRIKRSRPSLVTTAKRLNQTRQPFLPSPLQQLFTAAVANHRVGRLADAERGYRKILALNPNHADSLHLLGVIGYQSGHAAAAEELIQKAIALNEKEPSYHSNLGNVLQQLGRPIEAIAHYERTITLRPASPEAHMNLGNVLQSLHKSQEAIAHYKQAIRLRPSYAEAYMNYANTLQQIDQPAQAIAYYKRALTLKPNYPQAYANLGHLFEQQGKLDLALEHYQRALALKPDYVEAHMNLGNVLQSLHKSQEAIAHYEQAIKLRPGYAEAYANYATTLQQVDKPAQAIRYYKQALALKPDSVDTLMNFGTALRTQGKTDQALMRYDQALSLDPNYAEAHMNKALLQLTLGNYAAGWREYEWRWQSPKFISPRRNFPAPQWHGEALHGQRILLHGEQGLGDCIQFLRYLPLVQAAGGVIVLELSRNLQQLAAELPGIAELAVFGEPLPPFDCQCPLMSLPLACRTTLETIPAKIPYLTIPPKALQKARTISWPTTGLRVGVTWTGNLHHPNNRVRSIPLPLLEPLTHLKDIHFYSLQAKAATQLAASGVPITDLAEAIEGITETAAVIAQLDLVISVDTAIAHLAGALGKPLWLLLSSDADWRWLQKREDSPWYPSARLFRQTTLGDWQGVIERVHAELQRLAKKRSSKALQCSALQKNSTATL